MTLQQVSRETAFEWLSHKYPEEMKVACADYLEYWAWPQTFGSTSGPFSGVGGQAFTSFTIEAWELHGSALLFCGDTILRVVDKWEGPRSDRL